MENNGLIKRIADAALGSKGQILLLLVLLLSVIIGRFAWIEHIGIPLDRVGYVAETAQQQGKVLFSRKGNKQLLALDEDNLSRWSGEHTEFITGQVVNLHSHQGRIWVKTRTDIAEINVLSGTSNEIFSVEDFKDTGLSFENARLVGVSRDERFYLAFDDVLQVIDGKGLVEGPYFFEGRRNPKLVEPNWRQGVVFVQGNTWTLYTNFKPGEPVKLDYQRGELQEVLLSPDGSYVVYAIQQGQNTEIWYSRVNGANAHLLYYKDKIFSNLEALWSPDSKLLVITVLGYETDAGYEDNFISTTLLYQPGQQGTVALARSYGPEVRALVPTAWDMDKLIIWFYLRHEEQVFPVSYTLFRK